MTRIRQEFAAPAGLDKLYETAGEFAEGFGASFSRVESTAEIAFGTFLSLNPNTMPFKITISPANPDKTVFAAEIASCCLPWMVPRCRTILQHRMNQLLNFLISKSVVADDVAIPRVPVTAHPFAGAPPMNRWPEYPMNALWGSLSCLTTVIGAMMAMWFMGYMVYDDAIAACARSGKIFGIETTFPPEAFALWGSAGYCAAVAVIIGIFAGLFPGFLAFVVYSSSAKSVGVSRGLPLFMTVMLFGLSAVLMIDIPFFVAFLTGFLFTGFSYAGYTLFWGLKKDCPRA